MQSYPPILRNGNPSTQLVRCAVRSQSGPGGVRVRDALQSSAGPSRARAAFQLGCCASGPLSGSQSANDDGRAAGVALSQLHGHASIDGRRPGAMSARTQRAQPTAAGGAHRRRGEGCSDEVKPGLLGGGRAAYRGHAGRSAADGSCMAARRRAAYLRATRSRGPNIFERLVAPTVQLPKKGRKGRFSADPLPIPKKKLRHFCLSLHLTSESLEDSPFKQQRQPRQTEVS